MTTRGGARARGATLRTRLVRSLLSQKKKLPRELLADESEFSDKMMMMMRMRI